MTLPLTLMTMILGVQPARACTWVCESVITVAPSHGAVSVPVDAAIGVSVFPGGGNVGTQDHDLDLTTLRVFELDGSADVPFTLEEVGEGAWLLRPDQDLAPDTLYAVTGVVDGPWQDASLTSLTTFTTSSQADPRASRVAPDFGAWRRVESGIGGCPGINGVSIEVDDFGAPHTGLYEIQVSTTESIEDGERRLVAGGDVEVGFDGCPVSLSPESHTQGDLRVRIRQVVPHRTAVEPGPWSEVRLAERHRACGCASSSPVGTSWLAGLWLVGLVRCRRGGRRSAR